MHNALFIHGVHDARVEPFHLRARQPGEVLLKVAAVGLSGSDLHWYKNGGIGAAMLSEPFVPGHEFGGWLEEDMPGQDLARGTLVAVDPYDACGQCAHCRSGHDNLCPNVRCIGAPPRDGAMTAQIFVPAHLIVPLPAHFTPIDAAMLEPLGVAIHAVDLARPKLLERVAVIGCGPIGLLIIQVLRAAGAGDIIAIDPQPHRSAMAQQLGATHVGDSVAQVRDITGGEGVPLVLEATNASDGLADAVQAARIGGRIVLVGIPDGDGTTLTVPEARRRALDIQFARRMGNAFPRAIALVASGKVDVVSMVSHRFQLELAPQAFARHAANLPGMIKSLIFPNGL